LRGRELRRHHDPPSAPPYAVGARGHWTTAAEHYARSLDLIEVLADEGALPPQERGHPARIRAELDSAARTRSERSGRRAAVVDSRHPLGRLALHRGPLTERGLIQEPPVARPR